jgi:hypothetical protein
MARERKETDERRRAASKASFLDWAIAPGGGGDPHTLSSIGPTTLTFTVEVRERVCRGHHGIALYNRDNQLMWGRATENLVLEAGRQQIVYTFPILPLPPGPYRWSVSLYEMQGGHEELDAWDCSPEMIAATPNYQHRVDHWNGLLNVPSQIEVLPVSLVQNNNPKT